ncbi:MAG TPA: hypothetical protein PL084_12310, partial [Chitinophagales bacterium]|nr:hypothetical protein [Chitinophagales bacterium]HRP40492.1 hypothetical protein [Chitinophagales bacterium]
LVTGFRTKKVSTFFRTIQTSHRTGVSTFASRTSQRTYPSLQKSQISEAILEHLIRKIIKSEKFSHLPKTDNKGEKSYFNQLKFELN